MLRSSSTTQAVFGVFLCYSFPNLGSTIMETISGLSVLDRRGM